MATDGQKGQHLSDNQIKEMILLRNQDKNTSWIQEIKENMKRIDQNFATDKDRIHDIRRQLNIYGETQKKKEMTVSEQHCRIDSHWSKKRWGLFNKTGSRGF